MSKSRRPCSWALSPGATAETSVKPCLGSFLSMPVAFYQGKVSWASCRKSRLHQGWWPSTLLGFLLLWQNTMTESQLGRRGFVLLTLPGTSPSLGEVRAETQIGQKPVSTSPVLGLCVRHQAPLLSVVSSFWTQHGKQLIDWAVSPDLYYLYNYYCCHRNQMSVIWIPSLAFHLDFILLVSVVWCHHVCVCVNT